MAALKKIKGMFWRDAESKSPDISPEPAVTLEPLNISTASPEPPAGVDPEFFGSIEKELAKAMPIEFAEFYNQVSVINEKFSNLDEATRYQLAFHAAQTALKTRKKNLTPASLIKSIAGMGKVLDSEKREFQSQNEQGYQSNLATVQKKAQEMSQGIKDRESRLEALQKEIDAFLAAKSAEKKRFEDERAQLISQRVVAEGEIKQLQQKKTERETQFNSALEAHRQRLEELKSELEDHLKNIK
jgi:chromosome segregation ATPase